MIYGWDTCPSNIYSTHTNRKTAARYSQYSIDFFADSYYLNGFVPDANAGISSYYQHGYGVGFRALKLFSFHERPLVIGQQACATFVISCASDLEQILR